MPFIKVWIHFIWSTKNREKLISKKLKPELLAISKITLNQRKYTSILLNAYQTIFIFWFP